MTPQQWVGFGVRLFAVWLALSGIGLAIGLWTSDVGPVSMNGFWAAVAVYVIVAIVLWFFPMLVAHQLVPRTRYEEPMTIAGFDLARVGACLLGLLIVARALPTLVFYLGSGIALGGLSALSLDTTQHGVVALFEIAFAVVLIVKSQAFARIATASAASAPDEAAE